MTFKIPPEVWEQLRRHSKATENTLRKLGRNIKRAALAIARGFFLILDDLLLIAGIALITRGVFFIYPPAGYMVLGLCLWGLAYLVAKKRQAGGRR